jgi:hypothetical protein
MYLRWTGVWGCGLDSNGSEGVLTEYFYQSGNEHPSYMKEGNFLTGCVTLSFLRETTSLPVTKSVTWHERAVTCSHNLHILAPCFCITLPELDDGWTSADGLEPHRMQMDLCQATHLPMCPTRDVSPKCMLLDQYFHALIVSAYTTMTQFKSIKWKITGT